MHQVAFLVLFAFSALGSPSADPRFEMVSQRPPQGMSQPFGPQQGPFQSLPQGMPQPFGPQQGSFQRPPQAMSHPFGPQQGSFQLAPFVPHERPQTIPSQDGRHSFKQEGQRHAGMSPHRDLLANRSSFHYEELLSRFPWMNHSQSFRRQMDSKKAPRQQLSGGEACISASVIPLDGPFSFFTESTTIGATTDGSASITCGGNSINTGADVFYSFTPLDTGLYRVGLCTGIDSFDSVLEILDDSCTSTPVACGDDGGCDGPDTCRQSAITVQLIGGTTYKLRVSGKDGATGYYRLGIERLVDLCENAISVQPQDDIFSYGSGMFSPDTPIGQCPGSRDGWFKFTAPRTGPYYLESDYYGIFVFDGCNGAPLTGNCGARSLPTSMEAGHTYWISVSTPYPYSYLAIFAKMQNICEEAKAIDASNFGPIYTYFAPVSESIAWFSFTPLSTGTYAMRLNAPALGFVVQESCAPSNMLPNSTWLGPLNAATTYYIAVHPGVLPPDQLIFLGSEISRAHDSCANAALSQSIFYVSGGTSIQCPQFQKQVWFMFAPNVTGVYKLSVGTPYGLTGMFVSESCEGAPIGGGCQSDSYPTALLAGNTYFIAAQIPDWMSPWDSVYLNVEKPPTNDVCAQAIAFETNNLQSTISPTAYHWGFSDLASAEKCPQTDDVWYVLNPMRTGIHAISFSYSSFYLPGLAVYESCDATSSLPNNGNPVDTCSSSLDWRGLLEAGRSYFVSVSFPLPSWFSLSVFGPPANTECGAAIEICVPLSAPGMLSTVSPGTLCPGAATLWYSFDVPTSAQYAISTWFQGISIFKECGGDLVGGGCFTQSWTETLEPGNYHVAVSGSVPPFFGGQTVMDIRIVVPPPNDECSGAIVLPTEVPGANGEIGGASPDGDCLNPSVWYSFTPNVTGTYHFQDNSGVVVGFLFFSSCDGSAPIGGVCTGYTPGQRLNAGTTYYIEVLINPTAPRDYHFSFFVHLVPDNDDCIAAKPISGPLPLTYFEDPIQLDPTFDPTKSSCWAPDVWYSYTASKTSDVVIRSDSYGFNVFSDCTSSDPIPSRVGGETCGLRWLGRFEEGRTYFIAKVRYYWSSTEIQIFEVGVSMIDGSDLCEAAPQIIPSSNVFPIEVVSSPVPSASVEAPWYSCWSWLYYYDGADVWLQFTPLKTSSYWVKAADPSTVLVFEDCNADPLPSTHPYGTCWNWLGTLEVGRTYKIAVGGLHKSSPVHLEITEAPDLWVVGSAPQNVRAGSPVLFNYSLSFGMHFSSMLWSYYPYAMINVVPSNVSILSYEILPGACRWNPDCFPDPNSPSWVCRSPVSGNSECSILFHAETGVTITTVTTHTVETAGRNANVTKDCTTTRVALFRPFPSSFSICSNITVPYEPFPDRDSTNNNNCSLIGSSRP